MNSCMTPYAMISIPTYAYLTLVSRTVVLPLGQYSPVSQCFDHVDGIWCNFNSDRHQMESLGADGSDERVVVML